MRYKNQKHKNITSSPREVTTNISSSAHQTEQNFLSNNRITPLGRE
uniref:P5.2 n=1 Tax=Sweet potato chlorotic stunt virus TaxID=81931 RepID=A0A3S9LKP6_9CLOS|nr:P5.2 [Sweet potato chlorotic stunt virus]